MKNIEEINKAAIKNSEGLCRLVLTDEDLLNRPMKILTMVKSELENRCGIEKGVLRLPTTEELADFVDPSIRVHASNHQKEEEEKNSTNGKEFFSTGKSSCINNEYRSRQYIAVTANAPEGSHEYNRERHAYLKAMHLYCDMVNRKAFEKNYKLEILPDVPPD